MPRRNALTTAADAQAVLAKRQAETAAAATVKRRRSRYDEERPAVACRVSRAMADELQAIATDNGLELGQLVAAALDDFLSRYKAGQVHIEAIEVPTTRRGARIAT